MLRLTVSWCDVEDHHRCFCFYRCTKYVAIQHHAGPVLKLRHEMSLWGRLPHRRTPTALGAQAHGPGCSSPSPSFKPVISLQKNVQLKGGFFQDSKTRRRIQNGFCNTCGFSNVAPLEPRPEPICKCEIVKEASAVEVGQMIFFTPGLGGAIASCCASFGDIPSRTRNSNLVVCRSLFDARVSACGMGALKNKQVTYLPHEAVAEVSENKTPIGRRCGIDLVRKSIHFRFNCFAFHLL